MPFDAGAVTGRLEFDASQALRQFDAVQGRLKQLPVTSMAAQTGLSSLGRMAGRMGGIFGDVATQVVRGAEQSVAATGKQAAGFAAADAEILAMTGSATAGSVAIGRWTSSATGATVATTATAGAVGMLGRAFAFLAGPAGWILAAVAALYSLYKVLQLIQQAIPAVIGLFVQFIRRGVDRVDELRGAAIELAAALQTAFPTERFEDMLELSQGMVEQAQIMDAAYVGTGRELVNLIRNMAAFGMASEVVARMQTKAGRDQLVTFANIIRMTSKAQDSTRAMFAQTVELRAISAGQLSIQAEMVQLLRNMFGVTGKQLKQWKDQGIVVEEINKRLTGYVSALSFIEELLSTMKSSWETIVDRILMKAVQQAYPDLVALQKTLNTLLVDEQGTLTEIGGYLVATIQVTWKNIKTVVAGTLDIIQTIWPELKSWEDVLGATVKLIWQASLWFRLIFVVIQHNVKMVFELFNIIRAGTQRDLPAMASAMARAFAMPQEMWAAIAKIRAELVAGLPEAEAMADALVDLGAIVPRGEDDKKKKKTSEELDKEEQARIEKWLKWIAARKIAEGKGYDWEIAKLKEVTEAHTDWYRRHPLELTEMWGKIRQLRERADALELQAEEEKRAAIEAGFYAKLGDIQWWARISDEAIPATIAKLQELYSHYAEWPTLAQTTARAIAEAQRRQADAEKRWAKARQREAIEARRRELDALELEIQTTGQGHERKVAWLRRELTLTDDLVTKRQLYVEITATERDWLQAMLAGTTTLQERLDIIKALIPLLTSTTAILDTQNEQRRIENELVKNGIAQLDEWIEGLGRRLYSERQLLMLQRSGIERTIAAYEDLGITAGDALDGLRKRLVAIRLELERQQITVLNLLRDAWQPMTQAMTNFFDQTILRAGTANERLKGLWYDLLGVWRSVVSQMIATALMNWLMGVVRSFAGMGQMTYQAASGMAALGASTAAATVSLTAQVPVIWALVASYNALAVAKAAAGILGGIPFIGGLGLTPLQAGGLVTQPTLALLGEKGPEMVTPLGLGAPGGPVPTVNVTIQAIDTQSGADFLIQNRRVIGDAVAGAHRDAMKTRGGPRR